MTADEKRKSIPVWQRDAAPAQKNVDDHQASSASVPSSPTVVHENGGSSKSSGSASEEYQAIGISEVRQFLRDPNVRDAPEDKKRSFLQSKGLSEEVIKQMLQEEAQELGGIKGEDDVEFSVQDFAGRTSPQAANSATHRETPPIVTYPEFLVKPQKPPPLVTIDRLINTAYVAGGLAAVFYGASKYVIEPMTSRLTEARHDFSEHAGERLQEMNARLERVVSQVPPARGKPEAASPSETESISSDPTELFHRDIGVQTSPIPSRRPSVESFGLPDSPASKTVVRKQEDRLRVIRSHLGEVLDSEVSSKDGNAALDSSLGDLREYLNGLFFAQSTANEYSSFQVQGKQDKKDRKDDAVAALRNEIRGVKGMLLSARRFPASKPAARAGA